MNYQLRETVLAMKMKRKLLFEKSIICRVRDCSTNGVCRMDFCNEVIYELRVRAALTKVKTGINKFPFR